LPATQLVAFRRIHLLSTEGDAAEEGRQGRESTSAAISFLVPAAAFGLVNGSGDTILYPGNHQLIISRGHGATLVQEVVVTGTHPMVIETLF
jgi:hypothetical protein